MFGFLKNIFPQKIKKRRYDAGSSAPRLQGWVTPNSDANVAAWTLSKIRNRSRDLVRNTAHGSRIVQSIVSLTVGTGIIGVVKGNEIVEKEWKKWSESTQCDVSGRHNFYGLQRLVMRCVVESGECIIRFRPSMSSYNSPIPLKLQLLEPDYIDNTKNQILPNGGVIINGIEQDEFGKIVAYWLHNRHPGANLGYAFYSERVSASMLIHVYREDRIGQMNGIPWYAPIIVKMREKDIFQDAVLKNQQIGNLFGAFIIDTTPAEAIEDFKNESPDAVDLEPGTSTVMPPHRDIKFSTPPKVENGEFVKETERELAAGVGITYEELTGDYSGVNFSSARMGRASMFQNVDQWQWDILIPQFCEPVGAAFLEAAQTIMSTKNASFEWTPPARIFTDPAREIPALLKAIRAGLITLQEARREQGYNPTKMNKEIAESNAELDALGIILDSDPRVDLKKKGITDVKTKNQ